MMDVEEVAFFDHVSAMTGSLGLGVLLFRHILVLQYHQGQKEGKPRGNEVEMVNEDQGGRKTLHSPW